MTDACLRQKLLGSPCFHTNSGKAMSKSLHFDNGKSSALPLLSLTFVSRRGSFHRLPFPRGVARHWTNCDRSSSHWPVLMGIGKLGKHLYFDIALTSVWTSVLVALGGFEAPKVCEPLSLQCFSLFNAQNLLQTVFFFSLVLHVEWLFWGNF